jgi:hypothetical protein
VERLLPVALVGAAAAVAVGALAGRMTAPEPPPAEPRMAAPPRDDGKDREIAGLRRRVVELESALRDATRREEPPVAAPTAEKRLRDLVKGEVSSERAEQVEALAAQFRAKAENDAASADARAAQQVHDEMERERRAREDAARGGAMTLIRKIHESKTVALDLVSSAPEFGKLFVRTTEGPLVDGPASRPEAGLADGATVRFPAGLHRWSLSAFDHKPNFPADVVIEGAGMDSTIVRIGEISSRVEIRSLTFRDVTIDTDGGYLTDLRYDEPATFRLERCRVIGFDIGAGGSVMLAASVAGFYATDSRFETGFGKSPSTGTLIRGGTILARFERCTIAGPMYDPGFSASGATTLVFSSCRFLDMGDQLAKAMESPPNGVRFESCSREKRDAQEAAAQRRAFLEGVGVTDEMRKAVRDAYRRVFEDPPAPK